MVIKVLVNKIKSVLPHLISLNQSNFILSHHILDIVIALELTHSMSKMKSRRGFTTIKVDLEKAYDHLCQDFIHATLADIGFPNDLINLIMSYIPSTFFKLYGMKSIPKLSLLVEG